MGPTPPKSGQLSRSKIVLAFLGMAVVIGFAFTLTSFGRGFLALGELFGAGALYGSDWLYPTYVDRFRITINVDVDGHGRSGTSVNEIVSKPGPQFLETMGHLGAPGIIGEALCIDLGRRGALVLTFEDRLVSFGKFAMATNVLEYPIAQIGVSHPMPNLPILSSGDTETNDSFHMAPNELWSMRLFPNPNAGTPSQLVDPAHLDSTLGEGAKIVSVTVGPSPGPMSKSLDTCLPWIKNIDPSQATNFIREVLP